MNQLEERARQARQDIEASTSLVEPMPFRPPPSHRAAVSTAAVLMIAGGGLAFGASRITSDGGVVESADPSDQSDQSDQSDAGRDSVPMIGSTAIEVDEPGEPADSTGRDSGPSSGAGSDSDSSPGSYADPDTDDRPAGDDASADESDSAADTEPSPDATEPDPEATPTDPTDGSDNDDSDNTPTSPSAETSARGTSRPVMRFGHARIKTPTMPKPSALPRSSDRCWCSALWTVTSTFRTSTRG